MARGSLEHLPHSLTDQVPAEHLAETKHSSYCKFQAVSTIATDKVYDRPLLYDIGFGYRNVSAEVELLLAWAARASGAPVRSALELAAGPADHAIEMASRSLRCSALDRSSAMCAYARKKANERSVALTIHEADMNDFSLGETFDLACTLLSSLMYVYTLDAMVQHLRSVARHLVPRGAYIVELPHPGDFLQEPRQRQTHWSVRRDETTVEVSWGHPDDPYDATTQVHDALVEFRVRRGDQVEAYRERTRMKEWLAPEFEAAVRLSGEFEIVARHGDFRLDAPFDDTEQSWRMIAVLRRSQK